MPCLFDFVVQQHNIGRTVHWDLMLQRSGGKGDQDTRDLATWQLPFPPVLINLALPVDIRALPDHRRVYLDCQGPVRGGRGVCRIFDKGRYRLILRCEAYWQVEFEGRRLSGVFWLRKSSQPGIWILAKSQSAG